MKNKYIQNNRNENKKKNDMAKKTEEIHIQENEYMENQKL